MGSTFLVYCCICLSRRYAHANLLNDLAHHVLRYQVVCLAGANKVGGGRGGGKSVRGMSLPSFPNHLSLSGSLRPCPLLMPGIQGNTKRHPFFVSQKFAHLPNYKSCAWYVFLTLHLCVIAVWLTKFTLLSLAKKLVSVLTFNLIPIIFKSFIITFFSWSPFISRSSFTDLLRSSNNFSFFGSILFLLSCKIIFMNN